MRVNVQVRVEVKSVHRLNLILWSHYGKVRWASRWQLGLVSMGLKVAIRVSYMGFKVTIRVSLHGPRGGN